jgi:tetratricopeptide (TPR) repeat protein
MRRLFSGIADIEPFEAASPAEAANLLFAEIENDEEINKALSRGLLAWLETQRNIRSADAVDREIRARQVAEAFDTVTLLSLPQVVVQLWRRYPSLYHWVEQLSGDGRHDLREDFLRTLAVTQSCLAPAEQARRIAFWLDICRRAGRTYPDSYVDVGLLGLQSVELPPQLSGLLSNEALCVTGLLNWLSGRRGLWSEFSGRWLALKQAFPHVDAYWAEIYTWVVYPRRGELTEETLNAWALNVGLKGKLRPPRITHKLFYKEEVAALTKQFAKLAFPAASERAVRIVTVAEDEAVESGNTEFVVKSACNLGQALLRQAKGSIQDRAGLALSFATTALRWNPAHTHAWSLWRDALAALNRWSDAERVAWESVRRFPGVAVLSNNLSQLLAAGGRGKEARELLAETLKRTNDKYTRTMLAGLLIRQGSPRDLQRAIEILREGTENGDSFCRNMLAGLLMRSRYRGDRDEAERHLRHNIAATSDARARTMLAGMLVRRGRPNDIDEALEHLEAAHQMDPRARVMLAHILWDRDEEGDRARAEDLLRAAGDDKLARSLLERLLGTSGGVEEAEEPPNSETTLGDDEPSDQAVVLYEIIPQPDAHLSATEFEKLPAPESGPTLKATPAQMAQQRTVRTIMDQVLKEIVRGAVAPEMPNEFTPFVKPTGRNSTDGPSQEHVSPAGTESPNAAKRRPDRPDQQLMNQIEAYSEAARNGFLLRHGTSKEKGAARKVLLKLSNEDDLPFARFLLLGEQPGDTQAADDVPIASFAVAFRQALQRKSLEALERLQIRFPQEALLCQLAVAGLTGSNTDDREIVADHLRRARIQGRPLGVATASFLELSSRSLSRLRISNDNEPVLLAALSSSFDIPLAA